MPATPASLHLSKYRGAARIKGSVEGMTQSTARIGISDKHAMSVGTKWKASAH